MNHHLDNLINKKFVMSFSGGKDSSLALYHAMKVAKPVGLIMMLEESGERSRSHEMDLAIIQAQAKAIGLPIHSAASDWNNYEQNFIQLLQHYKASGAEYLVTGDIDIPGHDSWHEQVVRKVDLSLAMPLWGGDHLAIVQEFISLGFIAIVVTVNLQLGMTRDDLGRILTDDYIQELLARGIDPCGESGEFHTTVLDGPIFSHPIEIEKEQIIQKDHYVFLPLSLKNTECCGKN